MEPQFADGAATYRQGFARGLKPDPDLWVDEWADQFQRIPPDTGAAEPGDYRTARTPYAREPMRCLSPAHPCRRVVNMGASQLMKTQIALNWIGASIHLAPANILALMPSEKLAKRVSGRIDKTIRAVNVLAERVAKPRSRDARNTLDTKEFEGGSLFCTTAGSASNLAELAARYVYGDEVDRWVQDVNDEGDAVELAEARGSTFGRRAKFYFSSSPTIKDVSRIAELFAQSDQRHYYVACPHCGTRQVLEWKNLKWTGDYSHVGYQCITPDCALIEEHHKPSMLAGGEWRAHAKGDGETVGFTINALYAPLGWVDWVTLARQYEKAREAQERGDDGPMQVFYNTRLALVWDASQGMTPWKELKERAENYRLGTVPFGGLILTAGVDVQDDRLELLVVAYGAGMERWVIDYLVLHGDPAQDAVWQLLDEKLQVRYPHACGVLLPIRATAIDSGGHHTQEVYEFTRWRRWRNVLAVKGSSRRGRPVLAQRPSKVDLNWRGTTEKEGAELWFVGTDTAKDWVYNRYKLAEGPGAVHFSSDLPDEFYEQAVVERRSVRYVKGFRVIDWVKPRGARNEVTDLMNYSLAAAHFLGLHRNTEHAWGEIQTVLSQRGLFDEQPAAAVLPTAADSAQSGEQDRRNMAAPERERPADPPPPAPASTPRQATPTHAPGRRVGRSGYLSRR
ncbi:phage terminase large subunit family protein [Pseudomonas aeruginosa]